MRGTLGKGMGASLQSSSLCLTAMSNKVFVSFKSFEDRDEFIVRLVNSNAVIESIDISDIIPTVILEYPTGMLNLEYPELEKITPPGTIHEDFSFSPMSEV